MRLREKLLTSLLLVPLAGTSAWAKERSNYDAFLEQRDSRSLAVDSNTAVSRGLRIEQTEQRLGVPTFAWAAQDGAQSKSVIRGNMTPESAARAHLQSVADSYRLTRDDVAGASLRSLHNTGKGAIIATFNQSVGGIPVFRNEIKVVMGQDLRLVAVSGYLAPSELALAAKSKARTGFNLGAADAVSGAFKDLTGSGTQATSFVNVGTKGDFTFFELASNAKSALPQDLATPARARQVYFMLAGKLEPAWYVEVNAGPKAARSSEYYSYVVSAATGQVLFRNNLTADAGAAFTYKVWAQQTAPFLPDDGPQGTEATPHPTGLRDGYQAPLNRPQLPVTLANSPYSKNDPWLPANATQTTGNNVDAYADLSAPDGFQPGSADVRAATTSDNTFSYVYDTTKAPGSSTEQIKASVVNLFFVNNFLHDWYYDSGFDEASANAQSFNFGRGGVEGDPIQAQAQDYGGRNNANMSTPADGASPRMQMYVFDGTPELSVTSPASLAGVYEAGSASYGKQAYDVTGEIKVPETNKDGCAAFTPGYFTGKVALIDRGTCNFVVKSLNAQNAGAIATVIANNSAGSTINMGGNGTDDAKINTPSLMITLAAGNAWKAEAATNPITVKFLRAPDQDRDGTLDNGIIAHEWGHYISNRLIGNAAGLSNNQGRSMGEGWGDFHAMLLQVRAEDQAKAGNGNWQGVYSTAGYVTSGGKNQGYYYGIRRLPYSTDMSKNGYTFKHIANFTQLPGELAAGSTASNSEVHNSGEVWATALWECYATLLNAHPFDEAQDRMKRYLIAAYKATPNAPTFTEARDAVLAVALAADPADYQRFVAAFAKRGLGFGAKSPDRDAFDHIGVTESFSTGGNLEVTSITLADTAGGCDQDGILDVGEQGELKITVRNVGGNGLSSFQGTVSSTSTTATLDFPSTTFTVSALSRGAETTITVPVNLTAVSGSPARAGLKVTFDSNEIPASAKTVTFDPRVNYDDVPSVSNTETFESGLAGWTVSQNLSSSGDWTVSGSPANHYVNGKDPGVPTETILTSPWLRMEDATDFVMSYRYRHSFEFDSNAAYDGAVLELSVDGVEWIDPYFDLYPAVDVDPGYTALIATGGGNPIEGLPAMALVSTGFPAFKTATLNFGDFFTSLGYKNIKFRFRIGSDAGVGGYGLDLDDVKFVGAAPVFTGQADQPAATGACNVRPVANAGPNRVGTTAVAEGTLVGGVLNRTKVTLNGTGSFDPDAAVGDTLSYSWTQVGGYTPITLTGEDTATPSFIADVDYTDVLRFQLVVTDASGKTSFPKTVDIQINNVNQPPVAAASAPATVNEGETATLDASASTDADVIDQGALSYSWTQTGGSPKVTLTGATSAKAQFVAPEVAADTQLTFTVSVTDGSLAKSTKAVAVTVKNVDRAPVANAGADINADARSTVTLSGTGSDPDGTQVTYLWEQTSGEAVTLTGADTATATFTAPDVNTAIELTFKLTVTSGGQSVSDLVNVTVRKSNRFPAGNFDADEGSNVTLDASGITDPHNAQLTYVWTQVGGPTVNTMGADTATLKFTAPQVQVDTSVAFSLTVTDSNGAVAGPYVYTVNVKQVNQPPVAKARVISGVRGGELVKIDASTSTDPDNETLTYSWAQTGGPNVSLTGANSAEASFTPPAKKTLETYSFTVTVKDAAGATSTAEVKVSVPKADDDGGGCSSTGGSAGGMAPLMAMFAAMALARRRKA